MIKNVVFDVGWVLIEWNAKHLYRKVFSNDEEIDKFFKTIDFFNWNLSMDAGKSFAEGVASMQAEFPQYAKEIALYDTNWEESVPGCLQEPVEVLKSLKMAGYNLYALTNFSKEKFELTKKRFDFFKLFDGILVSAEEKMLKPMPEIYELLCSRYGFRADESVFVDDNEDNIAAAKKLGFETILFKYPDLLRPQLQALGVVC